MLLALVFVAFAVGFRFAPHPLSFTPIAASLLYFGARAPRKNFWAPLLLLACADVVLTKVVYGYPFSAAEHIVTWAWYAAMLWLGTWLSGHVRPVRIVGASLAAAVSFFLVSNFAVWAIYVHMYPRSLAGLSMSYIAALPFFRNEAAADVLFTALFFAIPAVWRAVSGSDEKASGRIAAA
jgi:Family of unknown function (DUF6580)